MGSTNKTETLKDKVKKTVTDLLLPSEVDPEEIKKEVWQDLSKLYYKYGDELQKRAFREVIHEICEKIKEEKWDIVYMKIYREKNKE